MKLLVDMNMSPRWIEVFADGGFEAEHWSKVGSANASDFEIMAFAAAQGWTVLTRDLDFGSILAATGGRKPSVIQLRSDDARPEAVGSDLCSAIRQCRAELESGALLTLEVSRHRLTLLPLR
jgi:predicted nuclease of predicted toxin-antitoxin system